MGPLVEIIEEKALATVCTLRIIDLKNKKVMAELRAQIEVRDYIWLDCTREGPDVCVVTIGSNNNTQPDDVSICEAVNAAGMQLWDK